MYIYLVRCHFHPTAGSLPLALSNALMLLIAMFAFSLLSIIIFVLGGFFLFLSFPFVFVFIFPPFCWVLLSSLSLFSLVELASITAEFCCYCGSCDSISVF
jgi:hypothetical protein